MLVPSYRISLDVFQSSLNIYISKSLEKSTVKLLYSLKDNLGIKVLEREDKYRVEFTPVYNPLEVSKAVLDIFISEGYTREEIKVTPHFFDSTENTKFNFELNYCLNSI